MAKRCQLEFEETEMRELEELMKECGIRTKADLFNNALALFVWAIKEQKSGAIIGSINEKAKTYKELIMPVLSAVKPSRQ